MFAVVIISGKQYKVSPHDVINVDRLEGKAGDAMAFDQVLLINDKEKTTVGTPTVKGVTVKAKIVSQGMGDKIQVRRFKSKVRERKATGFRPQHTTLEIVAVS